MTRSFKRMARRAAPMLAAGMLLQAGSCGVDLSTMAGGLLTTVANNLLATYVFGAFNVASAGMF